MTNEAPTDAACGAPNSAGSASGLRSRPCSAAPDRPKRRADQDREQGARQADVAHDDCRRAIAAAEQPVERLPRRQAGRADHQRDDGKHDDQRRERKIEPKAARFCARHCSSGAFPTGFRLALQWNCGFIA